MTATPNPGLEPAWSDTSWCAVGDRLIYTAVPDGQAQYGIRRADTKTTWLRGSARGVVVVTPQRGYPRHECPDHHLGADDCVCGEFDDGWIGEHAAWAVVAWEMDDGGEPFRRAIERDDEGTLWKRDTRNSDGT